MEMQFKKQSFEKRLTSMLKVDFKRLFLSPLVYILCGISLVLPILILVMTSMMGGTSVDPTTGVETTVETFTNVWQAIGSTGSAMSMDLTSMCNINLMFFLVAIFVCIFVGDDFRSGYAKNLFTVRAKKVDYVLSKTIVCFIGAVAMFLLYFIGAMIGGAIAGLSFSTEGFGAGGVIACFISKIFISLIFVSIAIIFSTVAKQKLWLSILCSLGAGMLLFTMIPMIAPLSAGILNVIMCIAGGMIFAIGLGALSNLILNKTSLV